MEMPDSCSRSLNAFDGIGQKLLGVFRKFPKLIHVPFPKYDENQQLR